MGFCFINFTVYIFYQKPLGQQIDQLMIGTESSFITNDICGKIFRLNLVLYVDISLVTSFSIYNFRYYLFNLF